MKNIITEFPGKTFRESDIANRKVLCTEWDPNLKWAWDTGVGYGGYFAALKEGKIIGTKCNKCHRVLLPARAFCEWCFRPVDEWIYLKDTGVVNTFCIPHTDWQARRLDVPQIAALIEIDGSGGVAIMHLIEEIDPKKVKVGMKVKAVWKPKKEREGSVTDIKYWKPLKEE